MYRALPPKVWGSLIQAIGRIRVLFIKRNLCLGLSQKANLGHSAAQEIGKNQKSEERIKKLNVN